MLFISKFLHHVELIPFLLFYEMANGTIDPELVLSAVDDDFLAFADELLLDSLYDLPHSIPSEFS